MRRIDEFVSLTTAVAIRKVKVNVKVKEGHTPEGVQAGCSSPFHRP